MNVYKNDVILDSIPIDKSLKRYIRSKWNWLVNHNGEAFASKTFTKAKEVLLQYRSDPDRHSKLDYYKSELPFRKTKWSTMLFRHMDHHPHFVLDLIKIYTGLPKPTDPIYRTVKHHEEFLNSTEPAPTTLYTEYIHEKFAEMAIRLKGDGFAGISLPKVIQYNREGKPPSQESYSSIERKFKSVPGVNPDDQFTYEWRQYNRILYPSKFGFEAIFETYGDLGPSDLFEPIRDILRKQTEWLPTSYKPKMFGNEPGYVETSGFVHFIPKKGTYKWRPIAVPNRFLQMHMDPFGSYAYSILKAFPRDCTFDQSRFDFEIQSRIDSGKYVGSVDLSSASDNLPFSIIEAFFDQLTEIMPEVVLDSYRVSKHILTKTYFESKPLDNQDRRIPYAMFKWKKGQPLGTYPSFALLGITNNLLCELASYQVGDFSHPYCVLGDDVIFFNKEAELVYRQFLSDLSVPISEHKSYSGLLSEFAGKIFIKNQPVRYISDHAYVTWSSLFDYQRSTGVAIPWMNLPKKIQKRWGSFFSDESSARRGYYIAQIVYAGVAVNRAHKYSDQLIAEFRKIELRSSEEILAEESPWTRLGDNVVYHANTATHRNPQDWFKRKFRPVTTDSIVSSIALL